MWQKLLLSTALCCMLFAGAALAQHALCEDQKAVDSMMHNIWRHHHDLFAEDYQIALDSLLAICPKVDYAWQQKSMPMSKTGNWQRSFDALKHAAALDPEQWLSYQAFIKCIFAKDYEGALPEFEACEKLIKGAGVMDHSFDFFRGLCYLCLDSLPQAALYLKKDVDGQEQHRGKGNVHHVSLFYWGICQLKMKKYLDAELTFRECVRIYPQYPEPNFYLGITYAATGKKVLAQAYFFKSKQYLGEGYNSGEDQEFYVNYPFAIGNEDVDDEVEKLKQ